LWKFSLLPSTEQIASASDMPIEWKLGVGDLVYVNSVNDGLLFNVTIVDLVFDAVYSIVCRRKIVVQKKELKQVKYKTLVGHPL
jgi:hypothetical protein